MRLILHTAAYWLLWRISQEIPRAKALANAEFATLRLRLIKVAARVIETASRIRVAFASACPDAEVFQAIAIAFRPAPLDTRTHHQPCKPSTSCATMAAMMTRTLLMPEHRAQTATAVPTERRE